MSQRPAALGRPAPAFIKAIAFSAYKKPVSGLFGFENGFLSA
jgi:hypothetical protein